MIREFRIFYLKNLEGLMNGGMHILFYREATIKVAFMVLDHF